MSRHISRDKRRIDDACVLTQRVNQVDGPRMGHVIYIFGGGSFEPEGRAKLPSKISKLTDGAGGSEKGRVKVLNITLDLSRFIAGRVD